jgi:N-acetylglucosamine-6-phosphate deacetylase
MPPFVPIDFHCHGIGRFDFAEPNELVLDELETHLKIEGTSAILTLYLPRRHLHSFSSFVKDYYAGFKSGRYTNILGIGLEGPLLASFGGTPEQGCWQPTKDEWKQLSILGRFGLKYIVLSPNASVATSPEYPSSILEIVDILLAEGVRPALGHFGKHDPLQSARSIEVVCEHAISSGKAPLFTDHLFNDMPVNGQYYWRTGVEKRQRRFIIPALLQRDWTDENLVDVLGPVPATLIKYAKKGAVKISLNCDGDHVDIDICRRAIEFVGADNLMLMTDRIQSEILAGQRLHRHDKNSLLYQREGIVSGGTQSILRQLGNLMRAGVSSSDILKLSYGTALKALAPGMEMMGDRQVVSA